MCSVIKIFSEETNWVGVKKSYWMGLWWEYCYETNFIILLHKVHEDCISSSLTIFSISCFNYLLWCYRIYYCKKYTQTHLRKGRLSLRVSNLLKAQISRDLEIPTARSLLVSSFLRLLHSLFCRLSSFFYEVKVFGFSCIVWDCH